jgi:hypothetical protein
MSAHQAVFPVVVMARVLGVSEAGFHGWRRDRCLLMPSLTPLS